MCSFLLFLSFLHLLFLISYFLGHFIYFLEISSLWINFRLLFLIYSFKVINIIIINQISTISSQVLTCCMFIIIQLKLNNANFLISIWYPFHSWVILKFIIFQVIWIFSICLGYLFGLLFTVVRKPILN